MNRGRIEVNDEVGEESNRRIETAYDPELLRTFGHRLADLLAEHFQRLNRADGAVLNWRDPEENVRQARSWLERFKNGIGSPPDLGEIAAGGAAERESLGDRFAEIVRKMLENGQNLHHPHYIGHQVPASIPVAGLFDAVGAVTNQVMAVYEMGPWATAVESAVVQELGERIGWKSGEFSGLITHGGSLANLTGLLTARNVALADVWEQGTDRNNPQPVLVAQGDAHYSVTRSAGILGLGTNQVLRAPLDERRRMDPSKLDELLGSLPSRGMRAIAVSACACATPIGAFDPLTEVAEVCRRHDVWLHVDAAHGGAACFSSRYRHLVEGLQLADSVAWDAHKMLFVPALCAFVFYRNREHRFETFRQDAPYLFDPSAPGLAEFDSGLRTVECTKRAAAFGLWGTWTLFGPQLFADLVDRTFDMGRLFHEKLCEAPDFEPLHEPECNIVSFRHLPETLRDGSPERLDRFHADLRRDVVRSGRFYIVPIRLEERTALRVTIINPLTTPEHLDRLLDELRDRGRALLAE